jgi:HAD superfamily hydrolase (TIGR01484 family)
MGPLRHMRPLRDWSPQGIVGVLTDIDDTLTTAGAITAEALQALADLREAGFPVVAITGRPVGWSEPFAQSWPVNAIVAENGAVALRHEHQTGLRKLYHQSPETRRANFERLQAVLQKIEQRIEGAKRARDSAGRETDIAIDHSEFCQLSPEAIAHVVRLMEAEGMTATVSSIHINAWWGSHNKLTGARWIVRELWDRDLDAEMLRWVFVGDSSNDQVMFEHFPNSVGVANIRHFENELHCTPRYITPSERGAGFAEMARHLLKHRP